MYDLIHKESDEFVRGAFMQLLGREPDETGNNFYVEQLSRGTPKISIIAELIQSREARVKYRILPSDPISNPVPNIQWIITQFSFLNHLEFIHALYNEFLLRNPNASEVDDCYDSLNKGIPRIFFIMSVLLTEECQSLLAATKPPVERQIAHFQNTKGAEIQHIGIFLGFGNVEKLDGEGIGRFSVRLAEGILAKNEEIMIHVATTEDNAPDINNLFNEQMSMYPNRFFIHKSNDIDWINQNIPVEAWIIPFVGLELALYLHKPLIVCLHDLVHLHFRDMYYNFQPHHCYRIDSIIYKFANKASAFVFHSNFTRDHEGLLFLKLPVAKTYVIRLASPAEEYSLYEVREEEPFRNNYKLPGNYIVFPSAIRLHKNHLRLIEAFLKFRQTPEGRSSELCLVLTDDYALSPIKSEIETLLNHCGEESIRNSIVFLGKIPSSDVPSLYKYAIGTIVPTLFEGSSPFPVFESLLMDTPVALSRIEVAKEVIQDMDAFITFDPYSVDEMVTSIHELWKHNQTWVGKQKHAISTALQRTWSNVAEEYCEVIKSMLAYKN
ncbi:DUF4214 domain-containing protein [Paenibacillus vini]|uniref:DUF4214 domain-containing protein n=1 Tax=Paenibacillus vini TaxID=1476024 RepID=UPI001BD04084|nr:DUF4214 domain-containing protein [Paenibacillus vini]